MATKPWGVFEPGVPGNMSHITTLASLVSSTPTYILFYNSFVGNGVTYSSTPYTNILNAGYIPVFTWMPNDNTGVLPISNANVTAGTYDTFIDSYATGIKALTGTIYIRFAHEMNGTWYDWSPGNNGNTAASFVAMWQYVWTRFHNAGVTNVKWVWCPNVEWPGQSATLASVYPGDSYVDLIALDGYNQGDTAGGNTWKTFSQVYTPSITDIVALAPTKPFCICEMGCTEQGGKNKAAWIQDALDIQILNDSRITFFIYFDSPGSGQYQLSTSNDATQAFASALQTQSGFSRFLAHA